MRAIYEARVEHLGPKDHVLVECVCRHEERLTAEILLAAGTDRNTLIQSLDRKMRCRECDERGKVILSIQWADERVNPNV